MKTYTGLIQTLVLTLLSILVFPNNAEAQTGNLTGVVKNCITNQPIPGASVYCVIGPVITNMNGQYTLNGVPVGNQTVSAVAVGYASATAPCTIYNNQTTICNFCMNPLPGILTGDITNCVTGAPVVGALVTWGTYSTYSTTGGHYTLYIYNAGVNTMQVSKIGYLPLNQGNVNVPVPGITTINVQLNPSLLAPSAVTAILNTSQTAVNINWNTAGNIVEMMYDNMTVSQCLQYHDSGSFSAVKFTPCGYPSTLNSCKLYLCGTLSNFVPFHLYVYQDNGAGGMPGTILAGPFTISPSAVGWMNFTFPTPVNIAAGSFYVAMDQGGDSPDCAGLGVDTVNNQLMSFQKIGSGPWIIGSGNFMVHAIVDEPCGLVPPGSITYTISRLKQGQENTPALWTQVGSVTGSNNITDYSWNSLPCGPYRWGVKATYPCSAGTQVGFSNVIGKCWTVNVTIHGEKCCASLPKAGMSILITSLDVPDTIYTVSTDTSGTAVVNNMWKGHYSFMSLVFGCSTATVYATIDSDTTINIIMNTGPLIPPTGITVNDSTLLATWNAPMVSSSLLDERWTSGSFATNGWTISGGTNWQISTTIGNPAPSAMFDWIPHVVNYDEYLTSETFPPANSTTLHLLYDIQLDNYSTTTVNYMTVELWDGAVWHVLKSYNNSGGGIPWKSEVVDITSYAGQAFKIRFHASGGDSNDINWWNIDNIEITASNDMPCLIGYDFTLNGVVNGFTPDTSTLIPPGHVVPGHTYTACVAAIYNYLSGGHSTNDCTSFTDHYFYPPLNFTADSIECNAFLSWQKPQMQGGGTPPGLMGYNIYRADTMIHYCPSPDTLSYYDLNLNPDTYNYSCVAKYNMAAYGFSGYGYSLRSNASDSVVIICGFDLPFFEGWNQNTFTYNDWTFDPSQGNWENTSMTGNPAPTADFSWSGKLKSMNGAYDYSLVSRIMNASEWDCSHLFLDFDLKLIDHYSTSTEKMTIGIFYDNAWHQLGEYVNDGSFGWTTESLNIDAVRGKGMKIRFQAHGENVTNILHWYIDNIHIYGICLPPTGLQWTANSQQVTLNWTAPCSAVIGYNVFRSDSSGNPPFMKINPTLVTGTAYTDVPPVWTPADMYRYYVTAIQMDHSADTVLCQAGSDTVLVSYSTGIQETGAKQLRIYPNPAGNFIIISSDDPLQKIEVLTSLGKMIYTGIYDNTALIRLNTTSFSQGIYFMRLSTITGTFYRKVIISR
jgi:hypothetical protein